MNPKKKAELDIRTVGKEVLVHDPERGKVHVLNASAGKVLEWCDGSRTPEQLAAALAAEYGIALERAVADVDRAVADFKGLAILES